MTDKEKIHVSRLCGVRLIENYSHILQGWSRLAKCPEPSGYNMQIIRAVINGKFAKPLKTRKNDPVQYFDCPDISL